jgi:hypothetical protein
MSAKPKAGGSEKEALAVAKQKEQSARFIEAAREVGLDESEANFERAMESIAPKRS